ncbi:MAG TPA: hypothetical protein VH589_17920 [Trebonia sp.]|jgi:hypothetical protein
MAQIVLVHGIGQQGSTLEEQEAAWLPSLVKGVLASGHPNAAAMGARLAASTDQNCPSLARMAFYGDLFLPTDTQGEEAQASPAAEALAESLAAALLAHAVVSGDTRLAAEAANALRQADLDRDGVQGRGARVRSIVAVLDGNAWLTARIFGVLQKAKKDLLQVTRYLTEDDLRAAVQARVAALLDDDTQLVIGHSLGSVVAWEACWALGQPLPILITLGSPLGLDSVVYTRLRPQPPIWPRLVQRWVNVAHPDDVVAVDPDLGRLFPAPNGLTLESHTPQSKYEHHAAAGYLGDQATGCAVADALGG